MPCPPMVSLPSKFSTFFSDFFDFIEHRTTGPLRTQSHIGNFFFTYGYVTNIPHYDVIFLYDVTNTHFREETAPAKKSTKRRKVSSDEDDTTENLKPTKKKAMKQGSIMAAFGKAKPKSKTIDLSSDEDSPVKPKKSTNLLASTASERNAF